ncbi:acyl carrier protein [Catenulispora rubra]|uniref:acyl carrier protein n=1 Tax=Catenulispora rubra TaxID=280293 RepID=UPI0018927B48|nr:acyl carrier protein [Catenulispora rubra]
MANTADPTRFSEESVGGKLTAFLEARTRRVWEPTADLFESGAVTSLFAMELVVHIEQTFGVTIEGDDLQLDNFRTIAAMSEMVSRLKSAAPTDG